jgi:hypothetical protein
MSRTFTVATDAGLIELIRRATNRLVVVAPGLKMPVAEAIVETVQRRGSSLRVVVILDTDPEVCRLGYGEIDALALLAEVLKKAGQPVQTQPGLRIGLIVSDEEMLIFSPTPLLIEAGSKVEEKPNAIRLEAPPASEVVRACGVATPGAPTPAKVELGGKVVTDAQVNAAKASLKEIPPRRFDLARQERVFNYKLEFVEFAIEDYRLKGRAVPLPSELLGLADTQLQERFYNTFRVFQEGSPFECVLSNPEDSAQKLTVNEKFLTDEAARIRKEFFIPLKNQTYGYLIQKRHRPEFEKRVARLKELLEEYKKHVRATMDSQIDAARKMLIDALFPRVKAAPPREWTKRTLTSTLTDRDIRHQLESAIRHAFARIHDGFDPRVTVLFKGVNYETITSDEVFRAGIEKYFRPDQMQELLREWNTISGQDPPGDNA